MSMVGTIQCEGKHGLIGFDLLVRLQYELNIYSSYILILLGDSFVDERRALSAQS